MDRGLARGNAPVGLFVVAVSARGPAAEAGVQAGDFLTTINGQRLYTVVAIAQILAKSSIGGRLVKNAAHRRLGAGDT